MPKANIFQFKQFAIDQTGCAMKVNTDGVLLGALASANCPQSILDIGTGTGVIALMLAQRYPDAVIDAVEIDSTAAETTKHNFYSSPFSDRCTCYSKSFVDYFTEYPDKRYDLIVSNPPFFIDSLKSVTKTKQIARHTSMQFFTDLVANVKVTLSHSGRFLLILPVNTADAVTQLALETGLCLREKTSIASFADSGPHRNVMSFGKGNGDCLSRDLVIYTEPGLYTDQYQVLLKDFLTIF